jgi:hypothetical protein
MTATQTKAATEAVWTGWWRRGPNQAWRRVCSGLTSAETWQRLLAEGLPSGDMQVSRGDDPNRPYRAGGIR